MNFAEKKINIRCILLKREDMKKIYNLIGNGIFYNSLLVKKGEGQIPYIETEISFKIFSINTQI